MKKYGLIIGFTFLMGVLAGCAGTGSTTQDQAKTDAVLLGSIFYKACVAIAMNVGFQATDMKLIMAVLFLVILIVNRDRKRKVKGHA